MRHRWLKLRLHTYICVKCGCGKVNFQDHRDEWAQKYIMPSGETKVLRHTPPCELGPKTQVYLDRYAHEIAAHAAALDARKKPVAAAQEATS